MKLKFSNFILIIYICEKKPYVVDIWRKDVYYTADIRQDCKNELYMNVYDISGDWGVLYRCESTFMHQWLEDFMYKTSMHRLIWQSLAMTYGCVNMAMWHTPLSILLLFYPAAQ